MTDEFDTHVRRALANVVEAAPPALPFEALAAHPERRWRHGRVRLAAAALVLLCVGGAAGAVVTHERSDTPVVASSGVSAPADQSA
ncbi:MAG: hypothetical protein M3445_05800 [Actinomycetota bacterium]|nr:hypothetical protein [Actinomycetota bacterium]